MKSKLYIIIVLIALVSVYALTGNPDKKSKKKGTQKENVISYPKGAKTLGDLAVKKDSLAKDHSKLAIDCKACHSCEYPTKNDPCLLPCPRYDMISVHHTPDEGPVVVRMQDIKGNYGDVVFSHKVHAEMSEMTGGCNSCHHYNTTGPVLKCRECHSVSRKRYDLSLPDLESAYHRQCLNCHRQWRRNTSCKECHIPNSEEVEKLATSMEEKHKVYSHPKLQEPMKVVYETSYDKGKYVTFFHDEHTRLFGGQCVDCHQNENCTKCHDLALKQLRDDRRANLKVKTHKTFDEHHKPCSKCHEKNECSKCHTTKPMDSFNHLAVTGFELGKYHSSLKCMSCHRESGKFTGLNKDCNSCHNNFVTGKFDHKKVGITLDENHVELDCGDCHKNNNFRNTPDCSDCHDDKSFPKQLPGKRVK